MFISLHYQFISLQFSRVTQMFGAFHVTSDSVLTKRRAQTLHRILKTTISLITDS